MQLHERLLEDVDRGFPFGMSMEMYEQRLSELKDTLSYRNKGLEDAQWLLEVAEARELLSAQDTAASGSSMHDVDPQTIDGNPDMRSDLGSHSDSQVPLEEVILTVAYLEDLLDIERSGGNVSWPHTGKNVLARRCQQTG